MDGPESEGLLRHRTYCTVLALRGEFREFPSRQRLTLPHILGVTSSGCFMSEAVVHFPASNREVLPSASELSCVETYRHVQRMSVVEHG